MEDEQPLRWERLPDAPTARLEAAAATVGSRLYLAGGLVPGGAVTDIVESFDPSDRRWSREPHLPEPLHHASAVEFRGRLVVLGGFRPGVGGLFSSASDRVYSLGCPERVECEGDGPWVRLASLRRARGAGGAGTVADEIVFAGGQAEGRLVRPTEVFDGRKWRDAAPIATPRDHVAAAADGRPGFDFFYVLGGRRLSIESVVDAAEMYVPERDEWVPLVSPLGTPRGGFGAAFVKNLVVTVGGEGSDSPSGTFDTVEAFVPEVDGWTNLPPLPVALHAAGVAAIDDILYVATGGPEAGSSYSSHLFALDFRGNVYP